MSENNFEKLETDCKILQDAKKIISDYYSDFSDDANAPKVNDYLDTIQSDDIHNPMLQLKNKFNDACLVLDTLFIIKKSKLLHLS